MKKFLSIILVLIICAMSLSIIFTNAIEYPENISGEYEYIFVVEEARFVLRYAIGIENKNEIDDEVKSIIDLNLDGVVTIEDARLVLRNAIKLEPISYDYFKKAVDIGFIDLYGQEETTEYKEETTTQDKETTYCFNGRMPSTKEEIINFYKASVNKTNNEGATLLEKRFQDVGDTNISGIDVVDNVIKSIFDNNTTEERAAYECLNTGKNALCARFNLTDYNFIKSASCSKCGWNYKITIITDSEDTPRKNNSKLSDITSHVYYWEDVERELCNQSAVVKGYDNIRLVYNSVRIEAEISPSGEFVYLNIISDIDILIGSAKVLIANLKDKQIHMNDYVEFYGFSY